MRLLVLLIFLSVALIGCKKECCDDSVDKTWLDAKIGELEKSELKEYFYIVSATYEGRCVTYVNNCCPMCATMIIVYSCDGTKLENVDLTKLINQKVAWKPDNFSCQL